MFQIIQQHIAKTYFQQVPGVLCMAEARPLADLASAASCSNDSAHSMQCSDALQPRISDPSMRMHTVQSWLESNSPTWSSIIPQDLATSEGECHAKGERNASKERAWAAPAQQSEEHAGAFKPIAAKHHEAAAALEQPGVHHQLSSDVLTAVQQHLIEGSAEQSGSPTAAETASQQVSAAAAAATVRQSAVQTLVQRFECMTTARLKISNQGDTGLGLLASALSNKPPEQRVSEVKMHVTPESASDAAIADDENCSDSSDSVTPSRQLQPSCTAEEGEGYKLQPAASLGMSWIDYFSSCQPAEWHLNTAFELEGSFAEQAQSDPALTRDAELAAPGAPGIDHAAAKLWPEGLAVAADVTEASAQRSGGTAPRYAVMSLALAMTVYAYWFCQSHCYYAYCYCDHHCCYCQFLSCMCDVKQDIASWHTAS